MGKKEEDEEEIILENPPKKHHFFKKFIIFIFIILLLLGGFKLYLYIGFVIGNDLAIKLSAEKNDITLIIGQTEELKFIIGREANPFCKTLCNSQLEDLSRGEKIENSFSLGTGNFEDVYTISSKDSKSGQDLYRYTINCKNIKDGLCSTSGDTAQRSIIITVEKEASLEELAKSNSIKEKLISQILSSHQFNFNIQNLKNNSNELSKTLPNIAEQISSLSEKTNTLNNKVNNSLSLWKSQSFSDLENYLTDNQYAINYLENDFNILFSFINTS